MSRRLKILISAYACSPYQGSEPGVGWGFVNGLARYHDLWVIVEEEKFKDDIERYLREFPEFNKRVRFFFIRKTRHRLLRKIWPPSYYWFYKQWHKQAYELASQLHSEVKFDLVHQLTMVGFREPGYLWRLGIPFVWGPVGGMGYFPWKYLNKVTMLGAIYYTGYNLINAIHMHFLARPKKAAYSAGAGLIAATLENKQFIRKLWNVDSVVIPEIGIEELINTRPNYRDTKQPIKLVWSGRHIFGKALNLALEALSYLPKQLEWEFHILGKGPCTDKWKKTSERLGIASKCHFHGWIQRAEAINLLKKGHLFIITSLRDLNSMVTVEALAAGLPVVCLDHCGFSNLIDESCGIKIPLSHPTETIKLFSNAVETLIRDEPYRRKLAKGALERAKKFLWANKIQQVLEIYEKRLSS